jgi:hypothetical protein
MMLGNLLNSLHCQLDDVLKVLLASGEVLWVDILSFKGRKEELDR